jgi:hypothetical protein
MVSKVHEHGQIEINLAAGEAVAVFSHSPCKVFQMVGFPNYPARPALLGETNAGVEWVSAAMAAAAVIKIVAGPSEVFYAHGTSPTTFPENINKYSPPVAYVGVDTITAADIVSGLMTLTHATGGTVALTLDTGANLEAATNLVPGQWLEWVLINLSAAAADTGTVTSPDASHTIVGVPIVASAHATTGALTGGNGARFRTVKTALNTFITYRVG